MQDPFQLHRFLDAQEPVYPEVLQELKRGRKESHWMWFIFPQLEGLGRSAMARRFAIRTLQEARAYADHALLGARLAECTESLLAVSGRSLEDILGFPDNLKFRSSMTLFLHACPAVPVFGRALKQFFNGEEDPKTTTLLRGRTMSEQRTAI